jgi:SAM-dependent methyltransferase
MAGTVQQPSAWSRYLGKRMSYRLALWILPGLVWNQEVYGRTLGEYVNPSTRWLDAGCGHRILAEDLEPLEQDLAQRPRFFVGVDLEEASLEKNAHLDAAVCASLDELPFADGKFDFISSNMVFEHVQHPEASLRELSRVLAPGGVLVIHTPNAWNYVIFAGRILKKVLPRRLILSLIQLSDNRPDEDIFPTFYRANSPRRLKQLGASAGLVSERCLMLAGTHTVPTGFFAPLAFFQLILKRLTMTRGFRWGASSILVAFRKQGAGPHAAASTHELVSAGS